MLFKKKKSARSSKVYEFYEIEEFCDLEIVSDIFIVREKLRLIVYKKSADLFLKKTYKWIDNKNDFQPYWHDVDPTASFYSSEIEAKQCILNY